MSPYEFDQWLKEFAAQNQRHSREAWKLSGFKEQSWNLLSILSRKPATQRKSNSGLLDCCNTESDKFSVD